MTPSHWQLILLRILFWRRNVGPARGSRPGQDTWASMWAPQRPSPRETCALPCPRGWGPAALSKLVHVGVLSSGPHVGSPEGLCRGPGQSHAEPVLPRRLTSAPGRAVPLGPRAVEQSACLGGRALRAGGPVSRVGRILVAGVVAAGSSLAVTTHLGKDVTAGVPTEPLTTWGAVLSAPLSPPFLEASPGALSTLLLQGCWEI